MESFVLLAMVLWIAGYMYWFGHNAIMLSARLALERQIKEKGIDMKKIDPDAPLTDAEWEKLGKPMHGISELPKEAQQAVRKSMRGRPPVDTPKKSISIRLDADIIEEYRSHGKGWQTEINHILRQWVENRPA